MRGKAHVLGLHPVKFAVGVNHLPQHIVAHLGAPKWHAGDIGHQAPFHFHNRNARFGVDDPNIGCCHNLAARTKSNAMHRGDDWHGKFAPAPSGILRIIGNAMRPIRQRTTRAARTRIAVTLHARQIQPGAKGAAFARKHDDPKPRHRLQRLHRLDQGRPLSRIERIHFIDTRHADIGNAVFQHRNFYAVVHRPFPFNANSTSGN